MVVRDWFFPLLFACAGFFAVALAMDAAGDYPNAREGPGLTLDEGFNVDHGVRMADRALALDPAGFRQACDLLPDHPPLGRLWIGISHEMTYLLFPPLDRTVAYSISCARSSGAVAYAALIFSVGYFTTCWLGRFAGGQACLALLMMPRLFGHAHIAALETSLNLLYALSVLYLADRWGGAAPPDWRTGCKAGALFGLALLTKVQAVLLPVPVALWALCVWRKRAIAPLLAWGLTALAVFFAGWPWLWHAPVQNLLSYLGRAADRAVIHVWYFGQSYADRDVPWHYPWVLFLVTVPVGLHLLGLCGVFHRGEPAWRSRRDQLLLACIAFPLLVFSIPGVAVYDGERLFLMVFPLWAVLIGRGAQTIARRMSGPSDNSRRMDNPVRPLQIDNPVRPTSARRQFLIRAAVAGFVLLQGYAVMFTGPCYLSYYNLLVGGARGAEALGLEPTYWGDSLTRALLQQAAAQLPPGGTVQVLPVMHPFQLREMEQQSPILREAQLLVEPYSLDVSAAEQPFRAGNSPKYVLLFMRKEYLPKELYDLGRSSAPDAAHPNEPHEVNIGPFRVRMLAAVWREGVLLAALCEFR